MVYCEVCGKPIENIKNPVGFLGWCRMQKVKASHHECRHGQRKFNPASGEKLPSIFKTEAQS